MTDVLRLSEAMSFVDCTGAGDQAGLHLSANPERRIVVEGS